MAGAPTDTCESPQAAHPATRHHARRLIVLKGHTTSKPADKLSEARSTVEERRFSAAKAAQIQTALAPGASFERARL